MKKIFYLLTAILSIGLVACNEDDTEAPFLEFSSADKNITAAGGEGAIVVKTNISDLEVIEDSDFITISETFLSELRGTFTVSFEADTNSTDQERKATITIKSGTLSVSTEITQQAGTLNTRPKDSVTEFDAAAGEGYVTIRSSNKHVSATADKDWVTIGAIEGNVVNFAVAENPKAEERSATITITAGENISATATITQGAMTLAVNTEASTTAIGVGGGKGIIAIETLAAEVNAEVSYDVTDNEPEQGEDNENGEGNENGNGNATEGDAPATRTGEDASAANGWLTIGTTTAQSVEYTVAPNASGVLRSAKVIVWAGEVKQELLITQAGADFTITGADSTFEAAGGDGTILISSDATESVIPSSSADWVHFTQIKDLPNILFSVDEYLGEEAREATITLTTGEISKDITITQKGLVFDIATEVELEATTGTHTTLSYSSSATAASVPTATVKDASWLTAKAENGAVIFEAIDTNIFIDRTAKVDVTLGWKTIEVTVKQSANGIVLFDKMVVNAPSAAQENLVTINALDNLVASGAEWTVTTTESWLTATKHGNSIVLGNEAFNDTWEIRNAKVNVMMGDKVLRTIEVYQMDKYALRGCWQFIDKDGNECEHISLRRHEQIPRGNKSDADYPYTLEIHDLKFKSYNQQPWEGIEVGDNSEPGVIFSYKMPHIQGWNNSVEFRMVPCNSLPWNEGFQCWGIDTNTGALTMDSNSLGFTFTYAVEEDGTEVLLVGQNAAMKAHPDADKMTGFSWVQFNKTSGKINGPMVGAGIYGNGNIAKMKRTFRPSKDDPRLTVIPGNAVVNASNNIYSDRYDDIQWF